MIVLQIYLQASYRSVNCLLLGENSAHCSHKFIWDSKGCDWSAQSMCALFLFFFKQYLVCSQNDYILGENEICDKLDFEICSGSKVKG